MLQISHLALLFPLLFICDFEYADGREFGYDGNIGPDHWAEDDNSCSGKLQSPININDVDVVERDFTPLYREHFFTAPEHGEILNNGHTVVVKLDYGKTPRPSLAGGPFEDDNIYEFVQLHFHWGENDTVGSEDRINNRSFPAELHLVFHNVKYVDFNEAVLHSDGVAVMAYFYELQPFDNTNYKEFTRLLEEVRYPGKPATFKYPPILRSLISDGNGEENYYTYTGSLTTPPCSESVTWLDFTTPIKMSQKQIEQFRLIYTNDGIPLTHNIRPIQPLNNRRVFKPIPRPPTTEIPLRYSNKDLGCGIPIVDVDGGSIRTSDVRLLVALAASVLLLGLLR